MLTDQRLVAFAWTADAARARAFYEGVLGLTPVIADEHLAFFDCGTARIGLQINDKPVTPPLGTVVGWNVADLRATMRQLVERGVVFDTSGPNVDEEGVWSPVPGQGVAWFFDPDHNRLSLNGPI